MKLTYYGHSSFILETSTSKILFDPFITPNELAKHIDINSLEVDYILQSHGHLDHFVDLQSIAKRTGAQVVSSWEITEWLKKKGIENVHPMNIGGNWKFPFGKVKMVFAAHSNSLPDGTYGGVAAGFVIEAEGKTLYYAGDTALTTDMRLLADKFNLTAAILPIGDNFTMDYKDACMAATFIHCNNIVAMHFDTFGFIKINHQEAKDYFTQHNKTLTIPAIGGSIQL